MINAAEVAMLSSAEDDAARQRLKAKLYAPPRQERKPGQRVRTPPQARMSKADAMALMSQMSAQDAQYRGGG